LRNNGRRNTNSDCAIPRKLHEKTGLEEGESVGGGVSAPPSFSPNASPNNQSAESGSIHSIHSMHFSILIFILKILSQHSASHSLNTLPQVIRIHGFRKIHRAPKVQFSITLSLSSV